VVKILKKFSMNNVKPVNILLVVHCKLSSSLCPGNEEEKSYMSHVLYDSMKFHVCNEMVSFSHAIGVVSRHMAKPGEENGNGCFGILEAHNH
jgi:hypothetical protein